jgi:hypothetical protein
VREPIRVVVGTVPPPGAQEPAVHHA